MRLMKISALLALVFLAAGASAQNKITVVLDWTVNTNHTGLYAAQAQGYFKQAGLEVEIQPAPDSGAVGLLASNRAQFAFSAQEEVIQSRAAGVPITAVAAVVQNNTSGFAARKTAGIHRPKDFEGKRYGGWGSPMEEAIVKTLVKADGGDPSKVKFLNIGEEDFFAATVKNIDFAWEFEGWTVKEGEVRGIALDYIDLKKFSPVLNWYTPVLASNQTWLEKNPTLAKAFLKALSQGYAYAAAHPAEGAALLLKAAPELNADLVKASQKFLSAQYIAQAPRWGEFDPARWNGFYNWMKDHKLVADLGSQTQVFTNEYLPPAANP